MQRVRRVVEVDLAVGLEVRGRLAVGDDQQHRLGVGVLAEVPVGEQQRVVQVGALVPHRVERGELLDVHHLGVPAEADQLRGASPRKRDRISWCSASAVRFIGTQRPSIAIENDVSTSSATAAWVRASVSMTSTSPMSRRTPSRGVAALGDGAA